MKNSRDINVCNYLIIVKNLKFHLKFCNVMQLHYNNSRIQRNRCYYNYI